VNRFNYLPPDRRAQAATFFEALREPHLRTPIVAVALALLLVGGVRAVEDRRMNAALRHLETLEQREAAVAPARRRVQALSTDITRLTKIANDVHGVRVSGIMQAEELAEIGNSLPAHVWLTAIRDADAGWSITGGARRISDVGSAMLALEHVPRITSATLVSTQAADRSDRSVEYELRLERRP
jgi:Tfp pilus assembly protein PilN